MILSNQFRQASHTKAKGFTLLEMMVTISIVAIMAAMAYPTYSELIRQWRRDAASKALAADLQLARSTAIKTSRSVTVCTTADGTTCGTSTDWKSGWLVITTNNTVIAAASAPQGISAMTSGAKAFVFLPNGLMGSAADVITIKPNGFTTGEKVNKITITQVGRAKITTEI